ncbi:MAG TPA: hypothetical protein VM285_04595 [Polyangia bacterium]|nr:hypothetical protein [Polyangia bacterium]
MTRWTTLVACLSIAALCWAGCKEAMVGAPCVPETDKGEFNSSLDGATYSIETRSVQCETRVCLTKTEVNDLVNNTNCENCLDNPDNEENTGVCEDDCAATQLKYSFCSCRCRDSEGNTFQTNPDKYDYLCECPPNTQCEKVIEAIEGAPEKITGSYCIPNCIAIPCPEIDEICVPSKDSEQPWQWKCASAD